jgi:Holliday junction resolvase RusA-like endonuclease
VLFGSFQKKKKNMLTSTIEFKIPGEPIRWKRPGQSKKIRFNTQYKIKNQKQIEAKLLSGVKKPTLSSVNIILDFYFKRASVHFRTGKYAHLLKESAPQIHCTKPDIDNLIKFYLDVFTGIIYKDDSQVTRLISMKHYLGKKSDEPYTKVWITAAELFEI